MKLLSLKDIIGEMAEDCNMGLLESSNSGNSGNSTRKRKEDAFFFSLTRGDDGSMLCTDLEHENSKGQIKKRCG
jgi:hypothetical protein